MRFPVSSGEQILFAALLPAVLSGGCPGPSLRSSPHVYALDCTPLNTQWVGIFAALQFSLCTLSSPYSVLQILFTSVFWALNSESAEPLCSPSLRSPSQPSFTSLPEAHYVENSCFIYFVHSWFPGSKVNLVLLFRLS